MAIKKKNSYKLGFLGFITILFYCLSATAGVVWLSVAGAAIAGKFDEKQIYPDNLYFSYENLSYEDMEKNRDDCLRITGITTEIKEGIVNSAPEQEREALMQNIIVDRTFTVKCDTENLNMLSVNLISSDPSIATVPETVNIGEPIAITPTLIDGVNKGGFIEIRAVAPNGIYAAEPLKVLVDISVESMELLLLTESKSLINYDANDFKWNATTQNTIKTILDNANSGLNGQVVTQEQIDSGEQDEILAPYIGEKVYSMFEEDVALITPYCSPSHSLDPTFYGASDFNNYKKAPKNIEYYLDDEQDNKNLVLDPSTGKVEAITAGVYKVWAKIFKTYDDQIFVEDYKFDYEINHDIPENELIGRYVYSYIYIYVQPITLEKIETNNSIVAINIDLFQTITLTASDLNIKLYSNRNDTTYFADEIPYLELSSSNPNALSVTKVAPNKAEWNITALDTDDDIFLTLSHQDFSEIQCNINNININVNEVQSITIEGTSSTTSGNLDLVELELELQGDEIGNPEEASWDFSNAVKITGYKNATPTYTTYKLFVSASFIDGQKIDDSIINEQGRQIVDVGNYYQGFGYEIDGTTLRALNRGEVEIVAHVIKTDINGTPIKATYNDGSERYISVSDNGAVPTLIVRVKEVLKSLNAEIFVEEVDSYVEVDSAVVVEDNSKTTFVLIPNSFGALYDAIKYNLLSFSYELGTENPIVIDAENEIVYLSVSNSIAEATSESVKIFKRSLTIQCYYTDRGYEILKTISFILVDVPVATISMQTTVEPINEGSKEYNIDGVITLTENNSVKIDWGQNQLDGTRVNFAILDPILTPISVEEIMAMIEESYALSDYIIPKALGITNGGVNYTSSDESILDVNSREGQFVVKKYNQPVSLTVYSTADSNVRDTIILNFKLDNYSFEWKTFEENELVLTKQEVSDGVMLEFLNFSLTIRGQNGNTLYEILSTEKINNQPPFAYSTTSNLVKIALSIVGSDYIGQYVTFDNLAGTGTFNLTVKFNTVDGVIITKDYTFTIVA